MPTKAKVGAESTGSTAPPRRGKWGGEDRGGIGDQLPRTGPPRANLKRTSLTPSGGRAWEIRPKMMLPTNYVKCLGYPFTFSFKSRCVQSEWFPC